MQRLTTLLLKNSRKSKINIVYLCIIVPTILVHVLRILQTKFGIGYAIYIDCINGVVEFLLLHLSLTIFGFFRRTDRCRRATHKKIYGAPTRQYKKKQLVEVA